MLRRLEGKVAIITGAAQGMGEAHARRFIDEGARVVMTDVSDELGEPIAAELGANARFIKADVTAPADWRRVVQESEAAFGLVTVLVNNAGILGPSARTVDLKEEDYLRVCAVNQHSQFYGMKCVIPSMVKAGGGSIINVSSVAGLVSVIGTPNIAYVGSRFASRGMTKHAAVQYGKFKIRVNSVHPGFISTPISPVGDDERERIASRIPLRRMGAADEVSRLMVWLASDESSYITGSEQVVDAGLTAQ